MMPDLLSALGRALAQCTRAKHKHRCGAQADGARLRIVFAIIFGKAKIWMSCVCNGSQGLMYHRNGYSHNIKGHSAELEVELLWKQGSNSVRYMSDRTECLRALYNPPANAMNGALYCFPCNVVLPKNCRILVAPA